MDLTTNLNFLSPLNFTLALARSPNLSYFGQGVKIPDVKLGAAVQHTPFVKVPRPGEHLDYDPVSVRFKVDEGLANWLEVYLWMRALGRPTSGADYTQPKNMNLPAGGRWQTSDINLIILNSAMGPIGEFVFHDAWPTYLSGWEERVDSSDVTYVDSTVTFAYSYYDVNPVV